MESLPIQCLCNACGAVNVYEKDRESYWKCSSWDCKICERKYTITPNPSEALVRIHNLNNKDAKQVQFWDLEFTKMLLKFLTEADGAIAHTIDEGYGYEHKFREHFWELEPKLNGLHRVIQTMNHRMWNNEAKNLFELLANHHRLQ